MFATEQDGRSGLVLSDTCYPKAPDRGPGPVRPAPPEAPRAVRPRRAEAAYAASAMLSAFAIAWSIDPTR